MDLPDAAASHSNFQALSNLNSKCVLPLTSDPIQSLWVSLIPSTQQKPIIGSLLTSTPDLFHFPSQDSWEALSYIRYRCARLSSLGWSVVYNARHVFFSYFTAKYIGLCVSMFAYPVLLWRANAAVLLTG